ncbi:MAG TPA: hypothetical protein VJQ82_22725 [Terriglobales bacterium]|jgi:hypothetical protein|nr:hypothetical protein [Terriglobales bacterium]
MASDSENEWNPISRPEFDERLEEEVADLCPDTRKIYEENTIVIVAQPCFRSQLYGIEHVFVVARAGARLLFFDDVEDEFAVGEPDKDGVLRKWGLCGELRSALLNLMRGSFSSS